MSHNIIIYLCSHKVSLKDKQLFFHGWTLLFIYLLLVTTFTDELVQCPFEEPSFFLPFVHIFVFLLQWAFTKHGSALPSDV